MAKVALLVGVSEYESGLNPLPGAVKDIAAMQQVLQHPDIGGFAENIAVLKNPDRQVMEEAIENLFVGRQKNDLVLLFFSGHGIKDDRGRLYLATRRTRKTLQGELIRSTAVSASFVQESMLRSLSRRQVVILDCCFSGAFAEGLSAKDDGTVDIRTQLGGEGRAVLTSSSSTQYSFELQGLDLSLYTRYLIEGIQTGAADQDEDGIVSIDELHEYAGQKVREIKPEMKPEIYAIREGYKIQLTKAPPIDPRQRYRREVERFINRKEISFVGRRMLDLLITKLELVAADATAIEDEILEPYRKEFGKKLQQYKHVFTEVVQRNEAISETDRTDLLNLQQFLELGDEDVTQIEQQVVAQQRVTSAANEVQEQKAPPVQGKKTVDVTPVLALTPNPPGFTTNQSPTPNQISGKVGSNISNKFRLIGVGIVAVAALFLSPMTIKLLQNLSDPVASVSPTPNGQIERDRANLERAKDLQNYLQFEYPKKYEKLNFLGLLKLEVEVDTDRVTIKIVDGYQTLKKGEDTLKVLTAGYMEALMGNQNLKEQEEQIPPKYTKFTQLTVYSQQSKQRATLTSEAWSDYLKHSTSDEQRLKADERLLKEVQITSW